MNTKYKSLEKNFFILNPDEKFYKDYYRADRSLQGLKTFLSGIDKDDAIRRHLVIPDFLPEIISYEMNDEEYFKEGEQRNVYISRHNRYTPAFLHRHNCICLSWNLYPEHWYNSKEFFRRRRYFYCSRYLSYYGSLFFHFARPPFCLPVSFTVVPAGGVYTASFWLLSTSRQFVEKYILT